MLIKPGRTASREFYLEKCVHSSLGLLHMVNWGGGCCKKYFAVQETCLHDVYHHPMAWGIKTLYFLLIGKWQLKNGVNKPCVHWMDCACLVHKICGDYNKRIYVQLIRSTTRGYFWGRQHGPAWKCIYQKNKPTKNAWNLGNLTKRTSELHERAVNSKKRSHCHLSQRRM